MKQIALVFAIVTLASATHVEGQQAAVTASATVVHGITTGWQAEGSAASFGNGQSVDGIVRPAGMSYLTHTSVVARTVAVRSGSPTLMSDGDVPTSRAVADVQWSTDGTTFTSLSTKDRAVTGAAVAGSQSQPLTYRVKAGSGVEDAERYSVKVSYTISLTSM